MRALSVIITPPIYRASGGVSAGLALAERIARLINMEAAVMALADGTTERGALTVRRFACTSRLAGFRRLAPRQVASTLWKSAIPQYIESHRPDIVHFHNPFPSLALLDAVRSCKRIGVPFVISSHGFVEFTRYGAAYNLGGPARMLAKHLVEAPFAKAARMADGIFILSPLERDLVSDLGVPPERQRVITNGVDNEFAAPIDRSVRDTLATRLQWRNDLTNLLFVGNPTFNKGLDILLAAMKSAREPVRVIVAGALRSKDQRAVLLDAAGISLDDPRVTFTDYVTELELRALYQMSDVFVFPSRADTLPLVILEAMICARPVIASDVGGIPFQVTADTGMVCPSGDVASFTAAIDRLARDPLLRETLGRAGRERAVSHFSWERSAELSVQAYADIIASQRPKQRLRMP